MIDKLQCIFSFITSPIARFVIMPLLTILGGSFLKYIGINDKYASLNREFFYIAPNMIVSSFILVYVDFCNRYNKIDLIDADKIASQLSLHMVVVLIDVIISIMTILIIRKFGWELIKQKGAMSKPTLNWVGGIIIPDCLGILMLFSNLLIIGI